ncbi:MAG: hypothetical protein QOJ86_1617 [Bradyrhizobium sp.]|jgi:hypothetical protein|nr:hypothetical protein [Bradyrhizobium sp.]
MRWQSQRSLMARYKLSRELDFASRTIACISILSVMLGWWNIYRILTISIDVRVAILDLADEQLSLINFLQPVALIYSALLCGICSKLEAQSLERRSFVFLSVGFLILAFGEININSHSIYIDRFSSFFETKSPAAILLPLLIFPIGSALYLSKLLRHLPTRHSLLFICCGIVYISGALGMEMASQSLAIKYGYSSSAYIIAAGLEETFETIGIVGFCLAVTSYIRELCPKVTFVAS